MKKCMIAAVAAVVAGGAFAKSCDYEPTTPDVAWAYTWKFTGKTTDGVKISESSGKSAGSPCSYKSDSDASNAGSNDNNPCKAVRVPASLKIQGYVGYCTPGCGSDSFEVIGEVQEVFWQTKPGKVSLSGGVTPEVSNIIGKKAKQYEAAGLAVFTGYADEPGTADEIRYDLVFAGLGKYDKKNSRVSSASGNFAGTLRYPWAVKKGFCCEARIWECENLTLDMDNLPDSVAFGKWSVKYNKKASKKLEKTANNIVEAVKIPKWVDKNLNGRENY